MLSSPCESFTTLLPLCPCACHSLDGEVSLNGLGTSLLCFTPSFREHFPHGTCVTWHNTAATYAVGHLMASPGAPQTQSQCYSARLPQTLWGSRELLLLGCAHWWAAGRLSTAHAVGLHVPPKAGLGCN